MKIARYQTSGGSEVYAAVDSEGVPRAIDGDIFGEFEVTSDPVVEARLLAPIEPKQIVGIGLNYGHHADESGMPRPEYPVVFSKTLNTVQAPGEPIVLPKGVHCEKTDYECELAVVIGRTCKDVERSEALEYVLGYTCANDVSARDWQLDKGGGQWSRGKSFDTFCPLGPVLVTTDEIPDPNDLTIRTTLNGDMVQDWRTDDMIFDVAALVSFLSAGTTLAPGTVILTGTPHGVGMAQTPPRWLQAGDVVTVSISGIGDLQNHVIQEV